MKILILGAGQVGTSVAAALASENNDITVVDTDTARLRDLSERLDIRTVIGHASLPSVLGQAGAEDAELLVARSEEHTSELQSLMRISYAVFCLKKKNN